MKRGGVLFYFICNVLVVGLLGWLVGFFYGCGVCFMHKCLYLYYVCYALIPKNGATNSLRSFFLAPNHYYTCMYTYHYRCMISVSNLTTKTIKKILHPLQQPEQKTPRAESQEEYLPKPSMPVSEGIGQ